MSQTFTHPKNQVFFTDIFGHLKRKTLDILLQFTLEVVLGKIFLAAGNGERLQTTSILLTH